MRTDAQGRMPPARPYPRGCSLSRMLRFSPLATLLAAAACTSGAARTAAPVAPTYAEAVGAEACFPVETYGEPLVVDWRPEVRADLEVAMRQGVAVVSYDCKHIRLLKDCSLEGSYGFMGITTKEQLVRLADADEIRANLPL